MSHVTRFLLAVSALVLADTAQSHEPILRARTPIKIPEVPGYTTLKCDFHIHTVFSDGLVWPTVRAEEAWREGLDVIAITDHIEYQPHKADVSTNHNRSYEIARGAGEDLQVMVIKGSEITRSMPPGHLNAIFLTNSLSLAVTGWREAIQAADQQGAFIFWNHPGWAAQIKDGKTQWYPEHTELLDGGMLHGIEVVNGHSYYPEAHRWAIEKKLTMLSNSDVHRPTGFDYAPHLGDHRPITLVFVKERTPHGLKEALFSQQTVVYAMDKLIGDEKFLAPIFKGSLEVRSPKIQLRAKQPFQVQLHNNSDLDYVLERSGDAGELVVPKSITLPAGKTVLLSVNAREARQSASHEVSLPFRVQNLLVGPDKPLEVSIGLELSSAVK